MEYHSLFQRKHTIHSFPLWHLTESIASLFNQNNKCLHLTRLSDSAIALSEVVSFLPIFSTNSHPPKINLTTIKNIAPGTPNIPH